MKTLTTVERTTAILKQLKSSNIWQTEEMRKFHEISEVVLVAIADDDAVKFKEYIKRISIKTIPKLRFEHNMNLLNLAID